MLTLKFQSVSGGVRVSAFWLPAVREDWAGAARIGNWVLTPVRPKHSFQLPLVNRDAPGWLDLSLWGEPTEAARLTAARPGGPVPGADMLPPLLALVVRPGPLAADTDLRLTVSRHGEVTLDAGPAAEPPAGEAVTLRLDLPGTTVRRADGWRLRTVTRFADRTPADLATPAVRGLAGLGRRGELVLPQYSDL